MIQYFLNELSFEAQFLLASDFERAAVHLIELAGAIKDDEIFFRSYGLFTAGACKDQLLDDTISRVGDAALRGELKKLWADKSRPLCWEDHDRCHDPEIEFHWHERQVTDSSLAEAADRFAARAILTCLFHLEGSDFDRELEHVVLKAGEALPPVPGFSRRSAFDAWWTKHFPPPPEFPKDASRAPQDKETCLRNALRFERTHRCNRGETVCRRIYREKASGRLFCVDGGHTREGRAELEVFDKHGQHLGTADLETGVLDPSKKEKGRKIRDCADC